MTAIDTSALQRRAVMLAWFTVGWNAIEALVALVEGVSAESSALIGFGLDSTIEVSSALVVLWQFRSDAPAEREARALRLIALSFFALATWVAGAALVDLATGHRPEASAIGIGLAVTSLIVMPILAREKQAAGERMGAATVVADSAQTWLCTGLSAVLLFGLAANAVAGWWWADPVAALVIAAVATREGVNAWNGENCCSPVPGDALEAESNCAAACDCTCC